MALPTNGELQIKLDNLEHRLFDEQEGFLPRIEKQTMKTNGRVNKHDRLLIVILTALLVLLADKPDVLHTLISFIGL
jgi:hypothetical protein